MSSIRINGKNVPKGQNRAINLNVARLASGTRLDVPVYVYRSRKKGPVLLLSAGLHGDEVNGIEAIRRMIADKMFEQLISGSVIAIPVMNIYGFLQFSRDVPDGKDINRSFPGNDKGSLAARVAHTLTEQIISQIDLGIDFHTGGSSRYNFPQVRYAPEDENARKLALQFGAPLILASRFIDKSLRKQAHKMGKSLVVFEGGESMRFDEAVIQQGIEGVKRVLFELGLANTSFEPAPDVLQFSSNSWVRARQSGLFNLEVRSGSFVSRNQLLGHITDPFGQFTTRIVASKKGFVIGHNNMPVVNQGDALFHIAYQQ